MELLGQFVGVWQMCGRGCDTPLIVVTRSRAHVSLCVCVNSTEKERAWGQGQDMLSPLSLPFSPLLSPLFTMHGGLSRIGCRQRGSKLIIQCAGNVSKASAGRLETSKGLFQSKLLNIPELM